jgi:hypothetical protein
MAKKILIALAVMALFGGIASAQDAKSGRDREGFTLPF